MPTLSERILRAPAGTYVDREVDRAFAHDGTGVLTLEAWKHMGMERPRRPDRIYLLFDHIVPANNSTTAGLQAEIREFARSSGVCFSDAGGGICHQQMAEGIVLPGEIIAGADSHTCTLGAFGAFATGVGATDMAAIWATGETWFRVPETIGVFLSGVLQAPSEAKDAALALTGRLGADGASYHSIEFVGPGVSGIPMSGRLTLCNLAVETGAKTGLFYADKETVRYLSGYSHHVSPQVPDQCSYISKTELELDDIVPLVAIPPRVDKPKPVSELAGMPVDQVFVGTCTNGRYEDLALLARALGKHKVAIRTIVVPASRSVLLRASETGVLAKLIEAGCMVGPPGCGPCLGAHMGVIGEGEVCVSTANRNFTNRMGVGGKVYLTSVGTAAATAIHGELTAPEEPT